MARIVMRLAVLTGLRAESRITMRTSLYFSHGAVAQKHFFGALRPLFFSAKSVLVQNQGKNDDCNALCFRGT